MGVTVELGRYVLHEAIASGGMASVHLARIVGAAGFSRVVAVKRLHPHLVSDPKFVAMFVDEARLASRIHHPNVSGTLDVITEANELFLVMDLVRGASLAELLRSAIGEDARPSVPVVVAIMVGALYGLHAAHEARDAAERPLEIVHRDVSPQNLLVGLDGIPRVVDFGIAKATSRLQETLSGEIKGKVAYMAPEQLRREPVDRRTDVYGVAVMLWEALTATRLHDGEGAAAVVASVLLGEAPPPSLRNPEVSADLDAVVACGLARDREVRFPTALAMAEALCRVVTPATPAEVGAWVKRVGGEALQARIEQIAALERATAPGEAPAAAERRRIVEAPTGPLPSDIPVPPRESTSLATADTTPVEFRPVATPTFEPGSSGAAVTVPPPAPGPPRIGRSRRWALAALLLAAASAGIAATARLRGRGDVARTQAGGTGVAGSVLPAAPPGGPSSSPPIAASTAPPEATSAPVSPVASTTRPAPRSTPRWTGSARSAAPAPSHTPAPSCDPPFTVDEAGIKRFKRWCTAGQ